MRGLSWLLLAVTSVSAASMAQESARGLPHWARQTVIRVWIDPEHGPSGADALVERAMTTWTRAAEGGFTLQRAANREGSAIRVRFVTGDSNYGETLPRVDRRTGSITEAEVLIAADAPAPDVTSRQIILYLTALHELGHALGLPHSDTFNAIMYRFRRPDDGVRYFGAYRQLLRSVDDIGTPQATGLSSEDIEHLRQLYER